jgi:hypothetical protein
MSMQRQEVTQLTIDDPTNGAVGVLAFDPEYRMRPMKRVETIANANAQSMQKYGYSPPAALIALEPKVENKGR